jgi:2-hydroxychromene-2-carboxylate isomerase
MSTGPGPIRFYFDYISHNAYLGWARIHDLAARYGRSVESVPVLFAGLLEAHGQLGPAEVPPKIVWMVKNVMRKAVTLGVPLHPPAHHPWNPLLSLRVSSLPMPEETRHRLIDGLFRAAWVSELHISEPEIVARLAEEAGLEGRAAVEDAQRPEAKERLRRQTDDAIAEGVFGVPTMTVDGELFWGFDDFPWLERFLAGTDPLRPEMLEEWTKPVTPSAERPREKRGRGR